MPSVQVSSDHDRKVREFVNNFLEVLEFGRQVVYIAGVVDCAQYKFDVGFDLYTDTS